MFIPTHTPLSSIATARRACQKPNQEKPTSLHIHLFTFTLPSPSIKFSSHVASNLQTALHNGWAGSIVSSYTYHVRFFMNFCDAEKIPQHRRFPADEILLCAFAASRIGTIAGDTAQKHISGLKAWYAFHNAPWHGGQRLHYILNGVSCCSPPSSTRPPQIPINKAMIKLLHDNLDPKSPFDVAV